MGESGQCHALYPQGKNPRYPLYRRLGGPKVWTQRLEEKSFASPGDRTPVQFAVGHILTELPQLLGTLNYMQEQQKSVLLYCHFGK
jgi:hypothetical protein